MHSYLLSNTHEIRTRTHTTDYIGHMLRSNACACNHISAHPPFWKWYTWSPWWRHQMETFSTLLAICAGNSPVPGEFPAQRPVTRSFDVFFDLRPIKRLSKQWRGWWFETQSRSLWRHRNATLVCLRCGGPDVFRCQWSGTGWLNDRFCTCVSAFPEYRRCDDNES